MPGPNVVAWEARNGVRHAAWKEEHSGRWMGPIGCSAQWEHPMWMMKFTHDLITCLVCVIGAP